MKILYDTNKNVRIWKRIKNFRKKFKKLEKNRKIPEKYQKKKEKKVNAYNF
jgi:hypothetical protein